MRLSFAMLIGVTLFAQVGFSQEEEASKIDVFGEYSYLRFNPTLTGLPSRNFNGGGGGATFFFGKYFGVKAELLGFGSTTWTATFPAELIVAPHGNTALIPAGTYSSSASMFTYQFGPVIRFPWKRASLFGETLFGGARTDGYGNLERAIDLGGGSVQISGTQNPFAMAVGGGLDVNVGKNFAIRAAEVDYFLTRFSNPISGTNNQNNFRYLAGFVFRFH